MNDALHALFNAETATNLVELNEAWTGLRSQPETPDLADVAFRSAHTIKGERA